MVVPGADNFEEVTDFATTNVQAVMKATNGAGWAIKASAKGFGGDMPVVVGFDAEGNIVGIQFMENSETAGYGQKLVDGSAEAPPLPSSSSALRAPRRSARAWTR